MKSVSLKLLLVGLPVVACGIVSSDVVVKVNEFSWTRSIPIEELKTIDQKQWCSSMPENAQIEDVERMERGKNKVELRKLPDGNLYTKQQVIDWYAPEKRVADDGKAYDFQEFQDYYGKRKNAGNVHWVQAKKHADPERDDKLQAALEKWIAVESQAEDCTAPDACLVHEYDFMCTYKLPQWVVQDLKQETGNTQSRYWPKVQLPYGSPCEQLGCHREGERSDVFEVKLTMTTDGKNSDTYCKNDHMDVASWEALQTDTNYVATKYALSGLDCKSIQLDNSKIIDVTGELFTPKSQTATVAGVEVKCCCLAGTSTNICKLAKTVEAGGIWSKFVDKNGCGSLVGSNWHSFTDAKGKLPHNKCLVSEVEYQKAKEKTEL